MESMRELIHGLDVIEFISSRCQFFQVSGQGGGVAADVDDAPGGDLQHGLDAFFVAALAGRIDADDVDLRVFALFFQFLHIVGQDFLCLADVEAGVCDSVAVRILFSVLDGLGDDLDTTDLFCVAGHEEADGADAAVEVPYGLIAGQAGAGQSQAVEFLGLAWVDLVEGEGRDGEGYGFVGLFENRFFISFYYIVFQ